MLKFKVMKKLIGGGCTEVEVEAHMASVGMSGALEFWRVADQGRTLIEAIARGHWISCKEVR